ncbi:MAG TPA: TonB-dependent receptor [Myxococcota bacterium]|nr:TonB-dependent receptor [Myxococcota bacterium]
MRNRRLGTRARRALAATLTGLTLSCVGALRSRAGELHESADDPSAFSTVIDARAYDDRFATVQELLEQVPGVQVQRFGGLGSYSTASIRGSKSEQVLVLLDGVRLNEAERGGVDLSTLPLRQIERIEVLPGAGAQRWGSDAVGGVISITTRKPESAASSGDASLGVGRYGTLGGDIGLTGVGESARGLASYTRLRSDNDFDFSVPTPDRIESGGRPGTSSSIPTVFTRLNAGFVEDAGLLNGTLDTGPHSRIDAMLDLYRRNGGEPGSIWDKPWSDATDETLSCTTADAAHDRGVARLGWSTDALGGHGGGGAFELAASQRLENGMLDDPGGACGFINPLVTGGRDDSSWRERSSDLDGRWRWPELDLGFAELRGQFASSLRYDTVDSSDSDTERRTTGLVSLLPELAFFGEELRVLPGLAVETASTSSGMVRVAASQPLVEFQPHDPTAWLPGIGAILQLVPGLRLKANWKRVMRRPTFTELFHPDWGEIRGNPTLLPERGWNADAGFELAAPGSGQTRDLRLTASVFQRELDQGIEWLLNVNNAFMPLNTGPSRALGAEVALGARVFEQLTLNASYTYTDAHYLGGTDSGAALQIDGDRRMAHVPEHAASLQAQLALGAAHVWTNLRYESEIVFQVGSLTPQPAAFQVDGGIAVTPHQLAGFDFFPAGLTLSVEGDNLTSVQRYDSLGLPLPKRPLWIVRVRATRP